MKTVICSHLNALVSHFEKYFFEDMEKHNWIRNPFVDNANAPQGFTSLEAEQFMDLSSDLILKSLYNLNLLISFWFNPLRDSGTYVHHDCGCNVTKALL